jgi:hypothetical protein
MERTVAERKIVRDSENGEFISMEDARARPSTTTIETIKPAKPCKPAKPAPRKPKGK